MALSLSNFQDINPNSYGVQMLLYIDEGYILKGISISAVDENGNNLSEALVELTEITFEILQVNRTVKVLGSPLSKSGYVTYAVENIDVSVGAPLPLQTDPTDVYLVPTQLFPQPGDARFNKSEYQAIRNNADANRSVSYIFDVDRSKSQTVPINYQSIISGSATPAQYQELNYSSVGLTNSRYNGAKSTEADYGLPPLAGLTLAEIQIFGSNTSNLSICSQSLSERTLVEVGFDTYFNTKPGTDLLPTASLPSSVGAQISGSSGNPAEITATQTTFEAIVYKSKASNYYPGRILQITNTVVVDYVTLVKAEYVGSYDLDQDRYNFTVERGADGIPISMTGNNNAIPAYWLNIRAVNSDRIFNFVGNKISPVENKKIYIPLTKKIIKVGPKGKTLYIEDTCSI